MGETPHRAETDPRLECLSDTDILLNFARALDVLYAYMRAVCAHCYDPYDHVVEPLFHALVFEAFSGKYGIAVPKDQCHTYEMSLRTYAGIHHIRVVPKRLPLEIHSSGGAKSLTDEDLVARDLVFLNFGDGVHSLTSHESAGDPYDLSFHLTHCTMVDGSSLSPVPEQPGLWVPNSEVTYEFVEARN